MNVPLSVGSLLLVAAPLLLVLSKAPPAASLTRDEQVERAVAFMRLQVPNAERAFDAILAAEPYHRRANFAAGMAAAEAGRLPDAVRYFETVLEKHPNDHEVSLSLAAVYHNLGRVDEAAGLYEKLHRMRPDDPRVVYNQGLLALRRGDQRGALDHFEAYLKMPGGVSKRQAVAQTVVELRARLGLPLAQAEATGAAGGGR